MAFGSNPAEFYDLGCESYAATRSSSVLFAHVCRHYFHASCSDLTCIESKFDCITLLNLSKLTRKFAAFCQVGTHYGALAGLLVGAVAGVIAVDKPLEVLHSADPSATGKGDLQSASSASCECELGCRTTRP